MKSPTKSRSKTKQLAGYYEPKTAAEQRFWDSHGPDYRTWALRRKLTIDEAAALAMGLDPTSIKWMTYEKNNILDRFRATKAWVRITEKAGFFDKGIDLLGLAVMADDVGGIPVSYDLTNAASLEGEGLLAREKLVKRLERRIERLKQQVAQLNAKLAKSTDSQPRESTPSAVTLTEKTSAKIIIALLSESYPDDKSRAADLISIKNGNRSKGVAIVRRALENLGLSIDDATILKRLQAGAGQLKPS